MDTTLKMKYNVISIKKLDVEQQLLSNMSKRDRSSYVIVALPPSQPTDRLLTRREEGVGALLASSLTLRKSPGIYF